MADVIAVPQRVEDLTPAELAAELSSIVFDTCGETVYVGQHPGPVTQQERGNILFRVHEYLQFGRR